MRGREARSHAQPQLSKPAESQGFSGEAPGRNLTRWNAYRRSGRRGAVDLLSIIRDWHRRALPHRATVGQKASAAGDSSFDALYQMHGFAYADETRDGSDAQIAKHWTSIRFLPTYPLKKPYVRMRISDRGRWNGLQMAASMVGTTVRSRLSSGGMNACDPPSITPLPEQLWLRGSSPMRQAHSIRLLPAQAASPHRRTRFPRNTVRNQSREARRPRQCRDLGKSANSTANRRNR